jgi:hypothetical protein
MIHIFIEQKKSIFDGSLPLETLPLSAITAHVIKYI